jgi:anti-anti-sigma factor
MKDAAVILGDLRRTKSRFLRLWYRFQISRLTFRALCRRHGLAFDHIGAAEFPLRMALYTATRSRSGVMRLVRQPPITGGAEPLLRCWTEAMGEAVVLHTDGECDISTAGVLRAAIAGAFDSHPRVIVDLNGLQYLDGAAVRVLEEAARLHHTRFAVVASTRDIRRLFEILGVADALPVVSSVAAAQKYLQRQ